MVMMGGGCATQSSAQTTTSTTPEGEQTSAGGGVTPEQNDAIDALFRRKAPELQRCWTEEYEKTHDRKVEGDITVGMTITTSGAPSDVKILKTSLNNVDIVQCVTRTVANWSFPEVSAPAPYMRTVHLGAQF
jgi:hypothetical protein